MATLSRRTQTHPQRRSIPPGLLASVFGAFHVQVIGTPAADGSYARHADLAVSLMGGGTETQGVVLVNAVRMLDLEQPGAKKVESAPEDRVAKALARLRTILQ